MFKNLINFKIFSIPFSNKFLDLFLLFIQYRLYIDILQDDVI